MKLLNLAAGCALTLLIGGGTLLPNAYALTEEERVKSRENVTLSGKALVRIEGTLKFEVSAPGEGTRNGEAPINSIVTVVNEKGYAVAPSVLFNPEAMISKMEKNISVRADVTQLKYVFDDGSSVDAEVVLDDTYTGFAVLRPVQQGRTFDFIDTAKHVEADVLDEAVILFKTDKQLKYQPGAFAAAVLAKVKKPRTFYSVSAGDNFVGSPVFNAKAELIGFLAMMNLENTFVVGAEEVQDLLTQALGAPAKARPSGAAPEKVLTTEEAVAEGKKTMRDRMREKQEKPSESDAGAPASEQP